MFPLKPIANSLEFIIFHKDDNTFLQQTHSHAFYTFVEYILQNTKLSKYVLKYLLAIPPIKIQLKTSPLQFVSFRFSKFKQ